MNEKRGVSRQMSREMKARKGGNVALKGISSPIVREEATAMNGTNQNRILLETK